MMKDEKNELIETLPENKLSKSCLLYEKIGEDDSIPIIEQIFNKTGFSNLQIRNFFAFGFILFVEGFYLTLIPSTMIQLKNFYSIDDYFVCAMTSSLFLSVGLGNITSSVLSSKYSRSKVIGLSLSIYLPCCLILTNINNIQAFVTCFVASGFAIGLAVPVSNNTLAEVLPIKYRAFNLIIVWSFFVIAQMYFPVSMSLSIFYYEKVRYDYIIKGGSLICLILLSIAFLIHTESPRNLLITKQYDLAINLIEYNIGGKLSQDVIDILTNSESSVMHANPKAESHSVAQQIKKLFQKDYNFLTVITASLWCINAIIFYGPSLIFTMTIQKLSELYDLKGIDKITLFSNQPHSASLRMDIEQKIIFELLFYSFSSLICLIISSMLAEIKFLGRKTTLIYSYSLAFIFGIMLLVNPENFKIMFVCLSFFATIGFNVSASYSLELFSTDIRDTAMGLFFTCNRVGAVASQFVFLSLFKIETMLPYYLLTAFTGLAAICSCLFPYDTLDKPLDIIK